MTEKKVCRVALVTNNPAPYRLPVYDAIGVDTGIELHVIFCTKKEPNREWNLPALERPHYFLKDSFIAYRDNFIHFNFDIFRYLRSIRPDIVITTGFNPTHLFAVLYAVRHGCAHISMTDGTVKSERSLGWIHRSVRRWVFKRSRAFLAAAHAGLDIYREYGCPEESLFQSPLCVNNTAFIWNDAIVKRFDLMFCGRMTAIKNPLFVLQVGQAVARLLGRRVSICFVGSGPLEATIRSHATSLPAIDVSFLGFALQDDLPRRYAESRVFLLPSLWDPWGVVANEACAAGVPVISSPHAGVAGELVRDEYTGFVRSLDVQAWAVAAARLLQNSALYDSMSRAASMLAFQEYNFKRAADGIVAAVRHSSAPRVVIVQRRLTHYRVPFFEALRTRLAAEGTQLRVVYGNSTKTEELRKDVGVLNWGQFVPCHYAIGGRICWQNISSAVRGADLVIVTQENKLIYNLYALMIHRPRRIAFWGHGKNLQNAVGHGVREELKSVLSGRVDWWFAYSSFSADVLRSKGFPEERITVTNNSVDTVALRKHIAVYRLCKGNGVRKRLGLGEGPIGLFVGSLDKNKRLPFLIESSAMIRAHIPDFVLVIAGDGLERGLVEAAGRKYDHIRYVGVADTAKKSELLSIAAAMLNPGMIGLGILDAFVAEIPIITTDCGIHSPEIAYLEPGYNGLVTENDVSAFAAAVVRLLLEPSGLRSLGNGSAITGWKYSLDNMAERFSNGISECLHTIHARSKQLKTPPPISRGH